MAKKGNDKSQKTISAPKARKLERKKFVWTIADKAGPHRKKDSVPLAFALRELLGIAKNMKEVKAILNQKAVSVNGVARIKKSFPVGLFDVVEITVSGKEKRRYRAMFDSKRRIELMELRDRENSKIARIERKTVIPKGRMQYLLSDGTTFVNESIKAKVGDSVKFEVPSRKVLEIFELKEGNTAYLVGGRHVSKISRIEKIIPGTQKRRKLIALKENREEINTAAENIFVCGKDSIDKSLGVKVKSND